MDRLRKYLVIILGLLCVLFAVIAVVQTVRDNAEELDVPMEDARWGKNVEALARHFDRLVFVYRNNETFDNAVWKELKKNYIPVSFNPRSWPADDIIFNMMISKENQTPMCFGIFTPRLVPVFLTTKKDFLINGEKVDLAALLNRTAHFYYLNRRALYSAGESVVKNKLPNNDIEELRLREFAGDGKFPLESILIASQLDAKKIANMPTAALTENVRFAIRVYQIAKAEVLKKAIVSAGKTLCKRLEDKSLHFSELALLGRALIDVCQISDDKSMKNDLNSLAEFFLKSQNQKGFFAREDTPPSIRANAIIAPLLARCSKIFEKEEYFNSALKCAEALEKLLYSSAELPALVDAAETSQASSYEYAFTVKCFVEFYDITKNTRFLNAAKFALDEWNDKFLTKEKIWSINSKNSHFARYMRPIVLDDFSMPSYLGEGMQAVHKLERIDSEFDIAPYKSLVALVKSLRQSERFAHSSRASIKLVRFE